MILTDEQKNIVKEFNLDLTKCGNGFDTVTNSNCITIDITNILNADRTLYLYDNGTIQLVNWDEIKPEISTIDLRKLKQLFKLKLYA